ncbi:MAG: tRNA lysidine(34) synthetase TilS, partial [Bacteroidota bacterium]
MPHLKHLCRVESMLNRFQEYAGRNQLFSPGDTLIVGLSGGCDSMVLTHLLIKSGVTVIAAHVNYHLRGEESDADEKFVRDWCHTNGIEYRVLHASVENEGGIQETARKARYEWFRQLRHELDAKAIAVAHHMNDQAETVLHHLARGTGLKGAMGMSALNGDVIRPLLEFSRTEIESEARNAGVPFRHDSSNDKDIYTRNLIRHKVIPNLEQVNPQSVRHISDYVNLLGQYASAAEAWCTSWAKSHVISEGQTLVIPINELIQCAAPDVILHHLLGSEYTHSQANEIRKLLHSTTGKHLVLGNR